jgi:hypothetical protein
MPARPAMSDAGSVRRAAVVMALLVLAWGYAWILARIALRYCGPLGLATLRAAVGSVALFPALLWLVAWDTIRRHHPVEVLMGQE